MSKNDAWMPLYLGDYLADTMHLNTAQHGAYLLLLMHYWRNGPLPCDEKQLASIARIFDQRMWKAVWPTVRQFFTVNGDGSLHQKRMDKERSRVMSISDVRKESGSSGANGRWRADGGAELRKQATRSERLAEARRKGTHTTEEWDALLDICERRCVRCGAETVGTPVKDHIRPIYRGGSDSIENIQPLCRNCNSSKGPETTDYRPHGWRDKMPSERLPNAWQNAWQNANQNALQTPGQLQLEERNNITSLSSSSTYSPRATCDDPIGQEKAKSVVVSIKKALLSDALWPEDSQKKPDWQDQIDALGIRRRPKEFHLTPEQLVEARKRKA